MYQMIVKAKLENINTLYREACKQNVLGNEHKEKQRAFGYLALTHSYSATYGQLDKYSQVTRM